ncbi:MAG TPA: hypothetical protein VFS42_07990, partial [Burkholderiaceae bacterium]|nr:hypothetical protein [Burkholderiaceae bacterium]
HGQAQAQKSAQWIGQILQNHSLALQAISSPATRACETMAALTTNYVVDSRLAPGRSGREYLELARHRLTHATDAVVLVGHQPCIGEAIASLMFGASASVHVERSSVWWFAPDESAASGSSSVILRGLFAP